MEKNYVLAYDLGTTGNKAIIMDGDCQLVASAFAPYQTFFPFTKAVEQDPADWWGSVRETTQQVLQQGIDSHAIRGIVFSGQMMGCVPVNSEAEPLGRGIIWADMRGRQQAETLLSEMGSQALYEILGNRVTASYSAAKMMWIRDYESDRFRRVYKFLQPKDFLIARMTGRFVTDFSDACGTNLFDIERREWSTMILEAAEIPQGVLPDLAASTDIVGKLSHSAASELGLRDGIPIVIGGGDGACAAAGAGAIAASQTYQYLGSSSWLGTVSSHPLLDSEARIFNWTHVVPGLYAPTGTMQAAGASFQWFKTTLGVKPEGGKRAYEIMDDMAAASTGPENGLIFLPYLLGERSPVWNDNARGAFIGLHMSHRPGDLVRAVMEGIALNMKGILDALTTQVSVKQLRFIGGGAKSRLWAQIFSDVYGYPLKVPNTLDEATAMGAALTGGVGVGLFSSFDVIQQVFQNERCVTPNADRHDAYLRLQSTYQEAYRSLIGIFDNLINLSSR